MKQTQITLQQQALDDLLTGRERTLKALLRYIDCFQGWNPNIALHLWLGEDINRGYLKKRYPDAQNITHFGGYESATAIPTWPSLSCVMSIKDVRSLQRNQDVYSFRLACIEIASYGPKDSEEGRAACVTLKVVGREDKCDFHLDWTTFRPEIGLLGKALCFRVSYREDEGNLFKQSPAEGVAKQVCQTPCIIG